LLKSFLLPNGTVQRQLALLVGRRTAAPIGLEQSLNNVEGTHAGPLTRKVDGQSAEGLTMIITYYNGFGGNKKQY
jgi:hypothetical protein